MPAPISLVPPSPGDGSGLCSPRETERDRRRQAKYEAQEAQALKMIERKRKLDISRGFGLLFAGDDGGRGQ